MNNILNIDQIVELTNLSKSTIWRMQKDGKFPKSRKLSPARRGWLASDIEKWFQGTEEV